MKTKTPVPAAAEEIKKLVEQIAMEFHPERIVLFGSHALGQPSLDSDVDMLIVVRHTGKNWRYATRIRDRLRPAFPVDLIVRSPDEMGKRLSEGDPFLTHIIASGNALYEADHP